ncbi:MAG TPA: ATP-binding protein [Dissulfurispiraceae bacterium]|nr:ATP-binding protein [Dissulfurispiraceae bacterium]
MSDDKKDVALLGQAIEQFNSASSAVLTYYRTLEDKVRLLTEEVDQKKQLLNSILDSIEVGVVFYDADGTVQLLNRAAEEMLGVSASAVIGTREIPAVFSDDDVLRADGRRFPAIISRAGVHNQQGSRSGSVLFFQDISRLKELEVENERNQRLTAMGELVTKIAHEIRNPLGSIELFASLLSKDLEGSQSSEYARRISNSVRHLVNTLDNMLRFSRGVRPVPADVSLGEIARELVEDFGSIFRGSGVEFRAEISSDCMLSADRGLLRQAFINMALNSFQAMPDGGRISIGVNCSDSVAEVSLQDTGSGMDAVTAARLFEPFFSTKDRGTGLGMSITASIIQAHHGQIRVKSAPGKGTTFTITLPVPKEAGT